MRPGFAISKRLDAGRAPVWHVKWACWGAHSWLACMWLVAALLGGLVVAPGLAFASDRDAMPKGEAVSPTLWRGIKVVPATELVDHCFRAMQEPPEDEIEARRLVEMKVLRTPPALQQIHAQAISPEPLFWLEAHLREQDNPLLEAHVRSVLQESASAVLMIKAVFGRKRPHVVNPRVEPVIEVPWHSAYPSGHATQGALLAKMLAVVVPSRAQGLIELGMRVGRNRELAGVHYPSDTRAGRHLADCFWSSIYQP